MDRLELTLVYKKATKGKYVYEEEGEQPTIQSLYIEKSVMGGSPPSRVQVIVYQLA